LVRGPLHIQGEWGSRSKTDDIDLNLRSIAVIREWLDGLADALERADPADPPKDPRMSGHGKSNVAG
jgi:hypothetical protein